MKRQWHKYKHYRCGFTIDELRNALTSLGFSVIDSGCYSFSKYDERLYKKLLSDSSLFPEGEYGILEMIKTYELELAKGQMHYALEDINNLDFTKKVHSAIYLLAKRSNCI